MLVLLRNVVSGQLTTRQKVRRERMVWEALEHPNILPFYGHADDEDFQPFGAFISPVNTIHIPNPNPTDHGKVVRER